MLGQAKTQRREQVHPSRGIGIFDFDALGSTQQLTDSTQTVTDTYSFDAYGNITAQGGTSVNPAKYVGSLGYYSDNDSGLQLLGHRYYDPTTGRFITLAPIKDGVNWYGYCGNNPVNGVDPGGLAGTSTGAGKICDDMKQHAMQMMDAGRDCNTDSYNQALLGMAQECLQTHQLRNHVSDCQIAIDSYVAAYTIVCCAGMAVGVARAGWAYYCELPSGLGDLTIGECRAIQGLTDRAGCPINVVGSAAGGTRGVGSDIDYLIHLGDMKYWEPWQNQLPCLDRTHGMLHPPWGLWEDCPHITFMLKCCK